MTGALALLSLLTIQRACELAIATRNTRRLLARGAYEVGAGHYPVMVALHATWLATLWWLGRERTLVVPFVAALIALELGRAWVLATLGARWTTRVLLVPSEVPVTSGPFRFVRHPNYLVVALELPCASLALGLVRHAILFGFLNFAMLAWRIRVENRAFALVERAAS